jgi:hypothetical protein
VCACCSTTFNLCCICAALTLVPLCVLCPAAQMVSRELEKECVVVFDEAHNIDNVCIEALSVNLRKQTLQAARNNIRKLHEVGGGGVRLVLGGGPAATADRPLVWVQTHVVSILPTHSKHSQQPGQDSSTPDSKCTRGTLHQYYPGQASCATCTLLNKHAGGEQGSGRQPGAVGQ